MILSHPLPFGRGWIYIKGGKLQGECVEDDLEWLVGKVEYNGNTLTKTHEICLYGIIYDCKHGLHAQ